VSAPRVSVVDDLGAAAGQLLVEGLEAAIARSGRARLAVPGGTGPVPVFSWLAEHLEASVARRTTLTWVDERHLPGADTGPWEQWPAESNRRGTWQHWLSRARALPAEVSLDAPGSLTQAREVVEARFRAELGGLDVVLLGMGPDGHIASLFPGHEALHAQGAVLAVRDSPKPPPERLTLSRQVLEDADLVVLVVSGAEKGSVLAQAQRGAPLPVGMLRPRGRQEWLLDRAAGEGLARS
jgi:6-phosphogluconolactonase